MTEELKDILESDYKFILIHGEYFDCPSCNDGASMSTSTHWDEKYLLEAIMKIVGTDKLQSLWVLNSDTGDMAKYSDIHTTASGHHVQRLEFDLPSGRVIIVRDKGGYRQLDPAEVILYGTTNSNN